MRACVRALPQHDQPGRQESLTGSKKEENPARCVLDIVLPRRNPPTARRGDGKRIRGASENSNSFCRVVPPPPRWGGFLNRGVWRRGKVTTRATAVQPISISQRSLLLLSPPSSTIGVTVSLQSVALCCRVSRRGGSPPATHTPPPPPPTKLGGCANSTAAMDYRVRFCLYF